MNAIKRLPKTKKTRDVADAEQHESPDGLTAVFLVLFGREPEPGEDFELVELRPGLSEARIVRRAGR
jgi:hypothetical protein